MKPCLNYRKKIALLALETLDPVQERDLRTHLEHCPACHAYWQEMSALTATLASAQRPVPDLETSESFHQRVVRAVRGDGRSSMDLLFQRWSSVAWRVALPVAGIGAVVVAVLSLSMRHPSILQRSTAVFHSAPAIQVVDLEPSVSNYQMVANESLDRLDELLTRQGNRNLPSAPRSVGPALAGANAWE
jgi:anti-sigma factor RsiW